MDSFNQLLRTLGPTRLLALLGVTIGLFAFFFFVITRMTQPQMGLLYSNLELSEVSAITQRLSTEGVAYELRDDGRTIMAQSDRISELRVSLASEGLGGNIVGYEIFDRSETLGTTSFVQNINRVRAIEGELSRTIREINAVSAARVHIVMPERQLFNRAETGPTASIVLRTRGGGLGQGQVRAIQYLVSAAVPGLSPDSVSIVDQRGDLLAAGGQTEGEQAVSNSVIEQRVAMENRLRSQIETLLGRTVGIGHVRAEVSVDMSQTHITTNSEVFGEDPVVRSSVATEEVTQNQDTTPTGDVTVASNLPDGQAANDNNQTSTSTTNRTETTTNNEISRTVTTEVQEPGQIERITVAVLVDGNYVDDGGGNRVYQPRSEDELDQMAALVRSAVGFDAERGDTLEVVNLQFASIEELPAGEAPFDFMGFSADDIKQIAEKGSLLLFALLVVVLIVRPLVMRLIESIPTAEVAQRQLAAESAGHPAIAGPEGGARLAAGASTAALTAAAREKSEARKAIEAEIDVATVEGKVQDSALKKVGDIVTRHPEEAASIVRNWLYSD